MSAYSQAANGFVVSDRVTLMLDMLDDDARARVLNQAYKLSRSIKCDPLEIDKENVAANAVYANALEIARAFRKRQKQSREARQVGAANREMVVRTSNDNREIPQEERREEKGSPTPPIKEESKEETLKQPPKPPARSEFVKPSVEEVAAYCKERGNTVDPHAFVDFYESKGWCIGKNKMKDWQAAVRTWERSRDGRTGCNSGATGASNTGRPRAAATAGNFRGGSEAQRAEASVL